MSETTEAIDAAIINNYNRVRGFSDRIIEPLTAEDCMVQSMEDVSPIRWHIAHTTWFFETFVLKTTDDYVEYHPEFNFLFNSYYNLVGDQFPRPRRGLISRPSLDEIKSYRSYVDEQMANWLCQGRIDEKMIRVIEIGLNHEQQHQELMLTDVKHVFSCNPLLPQYSVSPFHAGESRQSGWKNITGGIHEIGCEGSNFSFDNESPIHEVLVGDFEISTKLVTCGEFIEFIEDGGYARPELWLSLGWSTRASENWNAPLYWLMQEGGWHQFTLGGLVEIEKDWPVTHVSYFEADAFARWSGLRLPTEFEWEIAGCDPHFEVHDLSKQPFADSLLGTNHVVHPTRSPKGLMGGCWQWTSSSYAAYPGYQPPEGAIGEYNGKFMCNQYVLRGGSVATSSSHIRPTYRNFFPPETRWQFSGIRLARS